MTNRAIERIDEKIAGLEPGSLRRETLEAARRFKSSWVDLGRMLWTVSREKKFREWGYLTFEAYCAKEVGVREATAKKLLQSYFFLEKEEPAALKRLTEDPPARLPSSESVNLLRLLKGRQQVPAEDYQKVRGYVLEMGKEPQEVRREVREILQPQASDPDEVQAARAKSAVRRMIGTLRSLRSQLDGSGLILKKLLDQVESLAKELEEAVR